jgi:hypothetical protein
MEAMTTKSKTPRTQLDRLREEMVTDAMQATDQEILEETRANGIDPAVAADRLRTLFRQAVAKKGKQLMQRARGEVHAGQQRPAAKSLSIEKARALLLKAADNDPGLRQRLTLAARNGEALSDRDIQSLVEDLRTLGAFPEESEKS